MFYYWSAIVSVASVHRQTHTVCNQTLSLKDKPSRLPVTLWCQRRAVTKPHPPGHTIQHLLDFVSLSVLPKVWCLFGHSKQPANQRTPLFWLAEEGGDVKWHRGVFCLLKIHLIDIKNYNKASTNYCSKSLFQTTGAPADWMRKYSVYNFIFSELF